MHLHCFSNIYKNIHDGEEIISLDIPQAHWRRKTFCIRILSPVRTCTVRFWGKLKYILQKLSTKKCFFM